MNNRNDINVFDQYANGVLNEVERRDFENHLETDFNLQSDFEDYQNTIKVVQQFERTRLKEMLLNSEPPQRSIIRTMNQGVFRMSIAASIALLIGWMGFNYSQSDVRLYQAYSLDDAPNIIMSIPTSQTTEEARVIYEQALTLRETGEYENAIVEFEKIDEANINLYFISQYDIAMLQFKTGNKDAAKSTLLQLTEHTENHFIKKKAKEALNAMNRKWFF